MNRRSDLDTAGSARRCGSGPGPRLARRITNLALAVILVEAVYVGLWAAATPEAFATDFPGFGPSWTDSVGPSGAHFVRDVGLLHLAFGAIAALGLKRRELTRTIGVGWTVFALPHLVYHSTHMPGMATGAVWTSLASLSVSAAAGVALVLLAPGSPR